MRYVKTELGCYLLELSTFYDDRGSFTEVWNNGVFCELVGEIEFVQDNISVSSMAGTYRGMHYQSPPYAQGKLVRCIKGEIQDLVIDIRKGSPTFGQYATFQLSEINNRVLYVPPGFAHGFKTLVDDTMVFYKCTEFYMPASEGCISVFDKSLEEIWAKTSTEIISEKDQNAPHFKDLESPFIFGENS